MLGAGARFGERLRPAAPSALCCEGQLLKGLAIHENVQRQSEVD